jgi:hypothetical protein
MIERSENPTKVKFLFVGENRSPTAKKKGYTWENVPDEGALCARKLFTALRRAGVEPRDQSYINILDDNGNPQEINSNEKIVIAMGLKVQKELTLRGIPHVPIVHPAARGIWCRQEEYNNHIKEVLEGIQFTHTLVPQSD